jgi:hypothetical protein
MKILKNSLLGMAILAATLGPLVLPARAIVTAADSGAAAPPPPHRYYHRRLQRLTVIGPVVRTNGRWQKAETPWTDPGDASKTGGIDPDTGIAVLTESQTAQAHKAE